MYLKKANVGTVLLAVGCLMGLFVLSGIAYAQQAVPSIDIEKHTNGQDADTATGPWIPVGDPVTWDYIVTNDGNVDLTNVQVSDNMLGSICAASPLNVGEHMTCTVGGHTAAAGQYSNLGTATGDYDGATASDEDPSHYFGGIFVDIDIEKHTNGLDADTSPGLTIEAGAPVVWEYVVVNLSNVPLTNVTVTDDQGVAVSCPQTTLAVGESMICTANGTAMEGQYSNIGTARGEHEDTVVIDSDPSYHYGEVEFVPEWGSIALLGSGLVGLAGYASLRWRKR